MNQHRVLLDSFSGALADLPKRQRTQLDALRTLANHPRVSTWDRSELPWLDSLVRGLKRDALIVEIDEPYPWHRYALTDAGHKMLVRPCGGIEDTNS